MQYIDETPDVETRIHPIDTLNTVSLERCYFHFYSFVVHISVGIYRCLNRFLLVVSILMYCQCYRQIYVEIERARLIKKLAKIKEDHGQIAEAADCMPMYR